MKPRSEVGSVCDAALNFFTDVRDVEAVGEGTWSAAFAFQGDGQPLICRLSAHLEDFQIDFMVKAGLQDVGFVPEVHGLGSVGQNTFYCITARKLGAPLDDASGRDMERILNCLLLAIKEYQLEYTPQPREFGRLSYRNERTYFARDWTDYLLSVFAGTPRTRAGVARAVSFPSTRDLLSRAELALRGIPFPTVKPTLVHGDLLNYNVLFSTKPNSITAVFDLGKFFLWGRTL